MSSLIAVCARDAGPRDWAADLRRCAAALAPDNIRPNPPLIDAVGSVAVAVANPVPGVAVREGGVCLGRIFGQPGEWWRIGSEAPEGNYVIVRHDARRLEVLTDVLATRPTWYVHTPEVLLASTSQRALAMLLRSFELDPQAVTWMLTSGHLGAGSWDVRLRRLPGDCRLVLDRERWSVQIHERPAVRDPLKLSDTEHIERLQQAIIDTCADMHLPRDEWLLPLSGGIDSRVLLLGLLLAGERPRCVTWGLRSALLDAKNDAFIARELAHRYGLEHRYWPTDATPDSIETAMRRFLVASEGQVCDFGAYTDGMAMWKAFFEDGVAGVIRGDEPGLGYYDRFDSERQILRRAHMIFVSEYPVSHPIHRLGLAEQQVKKRLQRHPQESLASWDQRVFEEWVYPTTEAPLNAIKTPYVEIVNPLQSRGVTEVARRLPDHLRVDRNALDTVVRSLGPDVPTAKRSALGTTQAYGGGESGVAAMVNALSADRAERALTRPALDLILAGLTQEASVRPAGRGLAGSVKAAVPRRVMDRLRPVWSLRLGGRGLAFRAYVAVQMCDLLVKDAALLGSECEARGAAR